MLKSQYHGDVVSLGESRETVQPVTDFGGRHLPLLVLSFALRENLLLIYPPFYSPRLLSTTVPPVRFLFSLAFFFSFSAFSTTRHVERGRPLLLAENTSSSSSSAMHWTLCDNKVGSWVSFFHVARLFVFFSHFVISFYTIFILVFTCVSVFLKQ